MRTIRDLTLGILIGSVLVAGAVELTAASNKAVLAEVLTRLHKSADPAWNDTHGQAAVDSLCAAYGAHAGLRDANGQPRAATLGEWGAHVWGDWYDGLWLPYQGRRDEKKPSKVMLP